eukprot:EG_transcript_6746
MLNYATKILHQLKVVEEAEDAQRQLYAQQEFTLFNNILQMWLREHTQLARQRFSIRGVLPWQVDDLFSELQLQCECGGSTVNNPYSFSGPMNIVAAPESSSQQGEPHVYSIYYSIACGGCEEDLERSAVSRRSAGLSPGGRLPSSRLSLSFPGEPGCSLESTPLRATRSQSLVPVRTWATPEPPQMTTATDGLTKPATPVGWVDDVPIYVGRQDPRWPAPTGRPSMARILKDYNASSPHGVQPILRALQSLPAMSPPPEPRRRSWNAMYRSAMLDDSSNAAPVFRSRSDTVDYH